MKIMKKNKPSTEIPAASMSDIAFLLIIFFMVTTVFNKEIGINLELPKATQPPPIAEKSVLSIAIPAGYDGQILYLEGKEVPLDSLAGYITSKTFGQKDMSVVLKADENVPYVQLKEVLDKIQEGFINRVALVVEHRKK